LSIATNEQHGFELTHEQHGFELNGNESDDDAKENPTPPLPNCFSLVTAIPGGNNLEALCNPMSDMSDDKLFEVFTDGKYELFSNGFVLSIMSEDQNLLKGIVETDKSKATFLDGDGKWPNGLLVKFQVLPYIWDMCKNGHTHFFANICMSTIVTSQLGFDSAIKYVQCHGWTFCNKGRKANIRYHKLEQVIAKLALTKQAVELAMNFNTIIDCLLLRTC
jgi:hypothetical protein